MDVYVERLYAALADALRRGRERPFAAPVTVAEIYQDLVPYRVVRTTIGFEMNADYEHALLQLLSGEAGLARLEPDEAAAELRGELGSPNPNVGLFRKFAACDVWVADPGTEEAAQEERFAPEPVEQNATELRWESVAEDSDGVLELNADEVVDEDTAPTATQERVEATSGVRRCGYCNGLLPAGRLVRFCPNCGGDQTRRPCAACGEPLESGWRFCVACGAPQEQSPA